MKRFYLFIFLIACVSLLSAKEKLVAFPGAEGFGKYATGGRLGTVYRVTNLNDSGVGSLRDAVSQPNRIVVFDVSGVINLKSALTFSSNLTIAGQTAPGDGITVYGKRVSFSGVDNVICRYLRFRMGVAGEKGKDAAGLANGANMIFDHLSVSWGRDENFSISWDKRGIEPADITIQNSIIGQGLQTHSCGGLIQTNGGVTLYRNLFIDNNTRNPKVKGLNQYVNNVIYNWGRGGAYILGGNSEGKSWATIVNNYFIKGPSTSVAPYTRANENFQLYATGNYYDDNLDGQLDGAVSKKEDYGPVFWIESPEYWKSSSSTIPQLHPVIEYQMTAEEAYHWVLAHAGASLPSRDEVDLFMISELTSLGKEGKLIADESELGLYGGIGHLFTALPLLDTDGDGIPDEWEKANGTDPYANDAMSIAENGYANIENYINSINGSKSFLKCPVDIHLLKDEVKDGKRTVKLSWINKETQAKFIIVELSTDNIVFTENQKLAGTAENCIIKNLEPCVEYFIKMKAVNGIEESVYSSVFKVN